MTTRLHLLTRGKIEARGSSACRVPLYAILVGVAGACAGGDAPPGPPSPPVLPPSPPAVTRVELAPADTTITVGDDVTFRLTLYDVMGRLLQSPQVTWRVADTAVATVTTSGVVGANGLGTVRLTAAVDGREGSASVTVQPRLIELPLPRGYSHVWVHAVNDAGVVVGTVYLEAAFGPRAFVYSPRAGSELLPDPSGFSQAWAINDRGEIAGHSSAGPMKWTPERALVPLGTAIPLWCGFRVAFVRGINEAGTIAFRGDWYNSTAYTPSGVLPANGIATYIPDGPGADQFIADAINDEGVVAGWLSFLAPGRAASWRPGDPAAQLLPGVPPRSYARSIAAGTQVVGTTERRLPNSDLEVRGFYWSPAAGYVELGTLGEASSFAEGINDRGEVVGTSSTPFGATGSRAFLWTRERGIRALPQPGGDRWTRARAISTSGVIAGEARGVGTGRDGANWVPVIWLIRRPRQPWASRATARQRALHLWLRATIVQPVSATCA